MKEEDSRDIKYCINLAIDNAEKRIKLFFFSKFNI